MLNRNNYGMTRFGSYVTIDLEEITDWESFHDAFKRKLNFPDYYGRNLDAWIDCMGDVGDSGQLLHLRLEGMKELKERNFEIYEALHECAAFVNYRLTENGEEPALAVSYHAYPTEEMDTSSHSYQLLSRSALHSR